MAFLQWNDHFSVGVAEIDSQHKNLFVLLNNFYDGIKSKKTDAINELLNEIIDYTVYHFSAEEGYMTRANYPDLEAHKKEHSEFIEKVQNIKTRLDAGSLVLSLEVSNLLNEWNMNHFLDSDLKYSEGLKAVGLR